MYLLNRIRSVQPIVLYALSAIDILLGLATLLNYRLFIVGSMQCFVMLFYTLIISVVLPAYWLHPFAPLAKNIPLLVATLVMMALASER